LFPGPSGRIRDAEARVASQGIAVFGSSEPLPGDPGYHMAEHLGRLLARHSWMVVTGGYGGVMESASRGAQDAGGRTLGVTCGIFGDREPNPYLSVRVPTADLFERTRELIERSLGYIVLPGKAGTLAELAWLWALDRAGCLEDRPVVLLGSSWKSLLDLLEREDMLEPRQIRLTRLAATPEAAVQGLERLLEERSR